MFREICFPKTFSYSLKRWDKLALTHEKAVYKNSSSLQTYGGGIVDKLTDHKFEYSLQVHRKTQLSGYARLHKYEEGVQIPSTHLKSINTTHTHTRK